LLNPPIVVRDTMALLTYNLVNYIQDAQGVESVGSRWNATTVYPHRGHMEGGPLALVVHLPRGISEPVA
jgi:hypothetical protein